MALIFEKIVLTCLICVINGCEGERVIAERTEIVADDPAAIGALRAREQRKTELLNDY